jgi:hypothetical protein
MNVEGRCACIGDPDNGRYRPRNETKKTWVLIADVVREDLRSSFDCRSEGSGGCMEEWLVRGWL